MYKLINRIKAFIFFLPTIWKTEDWDYGYGVDLFIRHLEYLKKGIGERGDHKIVDEINTFIRMYKTYEKDPHFIDYIKICKSNVSEEEKMQAFENYTYLENYDREELFNYLRDNIENWWG